MLTFLRFILTGVIAILIVACGNQEETKEADAAFTDYREFVAAAENDANREYSETEIRAIRQSLADTSSWQKEAAERQQKYQEKIKRVRDNFSSYNETRQAEINDLEARYNVATEKQEKKYRDISHRYKLREELLGLPVNADDLTSLSAAELTTTYKMFVDKLESKAGELEKADWNLVEGWWIALNTRKTALESQLSADANRTIAELTEKYREIRERSETTD